MKKKSTLSLAYRLQNFARSRINAGEKSSLQRKAFMLGLLFLLLVVGTNAQTITVYPKSLDASVTQCNGITTKTFSIENSGADDLSYSCAVNSYNGNGGKMLNSYDNFSNNSTGMVLVNGFIYNVNYDDGTFDKYDTASQQVVATYNIFPEPNGIAYDGTYLWIGRSDGKIFSYSLNGVATGNSIQLPFSYYPALTYDGEYFIAANDWVTGTDIYKVDHSGHVISTYYSSFYIDQFAWVPEHTSGKLWILSNGEVLQANLADGNANVIYSFNFYDNNEPYSITHNGTDLLYADWDGPLYKLDDGISEKDGFLQLSKYQGVLAPGSSTNITATYNSEKLNSNSYDASILIESNDAQGKVETINSTFEVNGSAVLNLSAKSFDFGNKIVGAVAKDTLLISNTGCNYLDISSISSSNPAFTLNATDFYLAPGELGRLIVSFAPTSNISFNGTLSIENNLSDTSLNLTGFGIEPPILSVNLDTITDTLTQCKGVINKSFTITNNGNSDLTFSNTKFDLPLSEVLSNLDLKNSDITNLIPNRFNLNLDGGSNYIDDGGDDMYDGANYLSTNYTSEFDYTDGAIVSDGTMGTNGSYFTKKYDDLFVLVADLDNVDYFNIYGNLGADGDGNTDGTVLNLTVKGSEYIGFVTRTNDGGNGDPSINHLIIVKKNNFVNHKFLTSTEYEDHTIKGLSESSRMYYLLFATQNGGYISNANMLSIMKKFLNAIGEGLEWLKVSPVTGTITPGNSANIDVVFDASGQSNSTLNGQILINSNDPNNTTDTVVCNFTIKGEPAMELSATNFNYNEAIVGITVTDTLKIANSGCDTIKISNIANVLSEFTISTSALNILPGDTAKIAINFAPSSSIEFKDTLVITSNLDEAKIPLVGLGIDPPVLALNLNSFTESVTECNGIVNKTFTISNNGNSNLNFTNTAISNPLSSVLSSLDKKNADIANLIPNAVDFDLDNGQTANYISDGYNDMYDGANYLSTNYTSNFNYTDGAIISDGTMGTNGKYFTKKYANIFVLAADLDNVQTFNISGELGADGDGRTEGTVFNVSTANGEYQGYVTRTYNNGGDPSINHLVIVSKNASTSQTFLSTTDYENHSINGLEASNRLYYLLYAGDNSSYIDDAATLNIMKKFIQIIESGKSWINITPLSGSITPGNSTDINVEFNSDGLSAGTYSENIYVSSNDPNNVLENIVCTFSVDGDPTMVSSESAINLGKVYNNTITDHTLYISNSGCDTLKVSNILGSVAEITTNISSFDVLPGDTAAVVVSFAPTSAGDAVATLTIENNDADFVINMTSVVVEPPVLLIDNSNLKDTVKQCAGITSKTFTITNDGTDDLTFDLSSSAKWISISPITGTLAADASATITAEFSAVDLNSDTYNDNISVSTNDPNNLLSSVSCSFTVEGSPVLTLSKKSFSFPAVNVGATAYVNVTIGNYGCDTLKVSDINSSVSDFSVNATAFNVLPGESKKVLISFIPSSVGTIDGELTITSNTNDTSISLTGIGAIPVITSVTANTADGFYNEGEVIDILVNYNQNISVNTGGGIAQIKLNTTPEAYATYVSGSGSRNLLFQYTVGAGENASSLDYTTVNDLDLNGSVFTDDYSNTPDIKLPAVGSFAAAYKIVIDNVQPTVAISTTATDPTNRNPIQFTFLFDEKVKDLTLSDISVTNGTASNLTSVINGLKWTVNITPTADGPITLDLAAGSVQDLAGNDNVAATQFSIVYDSSLPLITMSSTSNNPTNDKPIVVSVASNVDVTGLELSDFKVTNGTASALTELIAGKSWTINVTPAASGDVVVIFAKDAAENAGGKTNPDSSVFSINYDGDAPSVVISSLSSNPTNTSTIEVKIKFSEIVTGFAIGDIVVTNGTASNLQSQGDNRTWTFSITPIANGLITVNVPAASAIDQVGNNNTAAAQYSVMYDIVAPSVAISSTSNNPTNISPIPVSFEFSEAVTGFSLADITVTNGVASNLQSTGNDKNWTADITPTANGSISIDVAANSVQDIMGYGNTAATQYSISFDNVAPTVAIMSTTANPTNASSINVSIEFSEVVTGFNISDVVVTNGTASNLIANANGKAWTLDITPTTNGVVNINVPAAAAQDAAGNNNTAATQLSVTYDNVAPTVAIMSTTANPTNASSINVSIEFSEVVTGFNISDVVVTNGTASNLIANANGKAWTLDITPTSNGVVNINVSASAAQDAAGNNNTAATQLSVTYDNVAPTVAITSAVTDPTSANPIVISIAFNETVSGFSISDLVVSNGTASSLQSNGDNKTWTANIVPVASGIVTVNISAAAAQDAAGNNNTAASQLSITYDGTLPLLSNVSVTDITISSANVSCKSNKNGTVYYVVLLNSAAAPTAKEVIAGTGNLGAVALYSNNKVLVKDAVSTLPVTGLSANTAYKVYAVFKDELSSVSAVAAIGFTSLATDINNISNSTISVYPNPVSSVLQIKMNNNEDKASYKLYSISGSLLRKGLITDGKADLNVESLMPSTYILRITNGSSLSEYKIIKK